MNTLELVDIATGVMDELGYLQNMSEKDIQELCDQLKQAFDSIIEEEE